MKRKNLKSLSLAVVFLAALSFFYACDMVLIDVSNSDGGGSKELTEEERDELEKTDRYLKLVNMPLNTQVLNVSSVSVANSSASIGKLNKNKPVAIYREADSCTVYLQLVYNDNSEFLETGSFYTAFTVNVDAVTKYIVDISDKLLVSYTDGRGTFDVNNLPSSAIVTDPSPSIELTEKERDELEKTERYLKLVNMPLNTQTPNVSSVSVANSSRSVGKLDKNKPVAIYREADSCTVYLPLVYNDNSEFLETGSFYTAFTIHVDAVIKYIVNVSDKLLVTYVNGCGTADINNLPSSAVVINSNRELTTKDRNELENTGHFLKLVNLPLNTQTSNVFSVSVANSSSAVGNLDKNKAVMIYRDSNSYTLYLPLTYSDNNSEFLETGSFYTAFAVHVDAVTKYIVETSDRFLVSYVNGRGAADVNNLPVAVPEKQRYLTISNLPASVSIHNFTGVSIHNQAGVVASCKNYSQIVLSVNNKATAKIPLRYNSLDQVFTENGVFYVLFDINVDVNTRYTVTLDDKVEVTFVNGDGFLDIQNIPNYPVPYLTLKGLPLNATKQHLSNVSVYNLVTSVAGCNDYKNIVVVRDNGALTFLIPLSYSSDGGYFQDSGRFAVSFTLNIDVDTQIVISRSDNIILPFTNGSAEIDLNHTFGFFNASLTNPNDSAVPVIKAGSSFDIKGFKYTVHSNYIVNALTPNSSCIIYLYAYPIENDTYYLLYEFSATPPAYNSNFKGWYNGNKRALWKMVYLYNTSPPQFLFKTYIEDEFPNLETLVVNNNDYLQLTASKPVAKSISGANNLAPQTIILDPGVYAVELKGAGGGSGRAYNGMSAGGTGGLIREVITLNEKTSFTAFTGSSGENAPAVSTFGTFGIITYTYAAEGTYEVIYGYQGHLAAINIKDAWAVRSSNPIPFSYNEINNSMSGGGGGGGGSGTFLYSLAGNYLLAAGGGGGGSGGSYLTPGGGGGAGGSIGPGAGGGASGAMSSSTSPSNPTANYYAPVGDGGTGGGFAGSSGGNPSSINGKNASIISPFLQSWALLESDWSYGGTDTNPYSPSSFIYPEEELYYICSHKDTYGLEGSALEHVGKTSNTVTNFTFSYSGSGGRTASIDFLSNVSNVGGDGASPLPLMPAFFSSNGQLWVINYSFTIGKPQNGQPGNYGGNNRNTTKGGGSAGGSPGSIIIHKIY